MATDRGHPTCAGGKVDPRGNDAHRHPEGDDPDDADLTKHVQEVLDPQEKPAGEDGDHEREPDEDEQDAVLAHQGEDGGFPGVLFLCGFSTPASGLQ